MTLRTSVVCVVLAATLAHAGNAQSHIAAAPRCDRIDTTASWYKRQAEWWALDAKHDWTDDSLRTRLLRVASLLDLEPHQPFPIQYGAAWDHNVAGKLPVDRLRGRGSRRSSSCCGTMAAKRQWPLRSTVGVAGVRATWLIAAGDSALTNTAMHRLMEAGPGEVSGTDIAVLEDWLRIKTSRKQIYGTQLHSVTDRSGTHLQPEPTEDLAHVILRRDAAGLPPLAFALCYAGKTARL